MQLDKRKALEAAGWKFGDAADFLGMTDEERQMLDLRVDAALAVRRLREAMKLSQKELARRIHTSQPRIVKIEKAAMDVTLDQILRAYAAAGGRIAIREVAGAPSKTRSGRAKNAIGGKKPKKVPVHPKVHIELFGGEL
jgi:ribosome-binding protein aMBF1 (putative translation factor)